jgi:hypothetical protein
MKRSVVLVTFSGGFPYNEVTQELELFEKLIPSGVVFETALLDSVDRTTSLANLLTMKKRSNVIDGADAPWSGSVLEHDTVFLKAKAEKFKTTFLGSYGIPTNGCSTFDEAMQRLCVDVHCDADTVFAESPLGADTNVLRQAHGITSTWSHSERNLMVISLRGPKHSATQEQASTHVKIMDGLLCSLVEQMNCLHLSDNTVFCVTATHMRTFGHEKFDSSDVRLYKSFVLMGGLESSLGCVTESVSLNRCVQRVIETCLTGKKHDIAQDTSHCGYFLSLSDLPTHLVEEETTCLERRGLHVVCMLPLEDDVAWCALHFSLRALVDADGRGEEWEGMNAKQKIDALVTSSSVVQVARLLDAESSRMTMRNFHDGTPIERSRVVPKLKTYLSGTLPSLQLRLTTRALSRLSYQQTCTYFLRSKPGFTDEKNMPCSPRTHLVGKNGEALSTLVGCFERDDIIKCAEARLSFLSQNGSVALPSCMDGESVLIGSFVLYVDTAVSQGCETFVHAACRSEPAWKEDVPKRTLLALKDSQELMHPYLLGVVNRDTATPTVSSIGHSTEGKKDAPPSSWHEHEEKATMHSEERRTTGAARRLENTLKKKRDLR